MNYNHLVLNTVLFVVLTLCSSLLRSTNKYYLCSWEVYWDTPKGSFEDDGANGPSDVRATILKNVLLAAKQSGIQHLVVVDDGSWVTELDASGIPYTCITCSSPLLSTPNFSFKDGLLSDLSITVNGDAEGEGGEGHSVCREDLAALCVQALQSLPWEKSRRLSVSVNGLAKVSALSSPQRRVDQQWCVNSFVLEEKLANLP